jgi:hypothetical protein
MSALPKVSGRVVAAVKLDYQRTSATRYWRGVLAKAVLRR